MEVSLKKVIEHKLIAKTITEKMINNIVKTVAKGQSPDLYFNLELAIEEATKYVEKVATNNAKADIAEMIEEFDNGQEPTHN
jgi:DNA-directed RNA polymerase subunit F